MQNGVLHGFGRSSTTLVYNLQASSHYTIERMFYHLVPPKSYTQLFGGTLFYTPFSLSVIIYHNSNDDNTYPVIVATVT